MKRIIILILVLGLFNSCKNTQKSVIKDESNSISTNEVVSISYNVNNYFPHDKSMFTEGLVFYDGKLYESSGSPVELPQTISSIGIVDLTSGKFDRKITLDKSKFFGEGIVIFNNRIFQLTYKSQTAFVYDAKSFKKIGHFKYKNKEGWGLTTDGKNIIMSDGTDILTFVNPDNFEVIKTIKVTEAGCVLNALNELEFINGYIYANVWMTYNIVKIDPNNGKVIGKLDLSAIGEQIKNRYPETDVMNGIAYNSKTDKIYITGKMWPFIYEIEFEH